MRNERRLEKIEERIQVREAAMVIAQQAENDIE